MVKAVMTLHLIEQQYEEQFYQSNIFNRYFKDLKIGVLDIETTGLNPDKSKLIIGGLLTPQDNHLKVKQFFLDRRDEEPELLEAYLSSLKDIDVLVTYNGDHFDLPFINRRIHANTSVKSNPVSSAISLPFGSMPIHQSFDLYRIIGRHSVLKRMLPNLKQKTVEDYMGLWSDRSDQISGRESVDLYYQYLKSKDPGLREIMLLHNRDDILQLSRLLKILDKLDLHHVLFNTGFAVSDENKKVFINKIVFKRDHLSVSGIHKNLPMDYRYYGISHEAAFSKENGDFTLNIPFKNGKGYSYVNLDEFAMDFSEFEKYAGFRSGYLILKDKTQINFAEHNHLVQQIIKEILREF